MVSIDFQSVILVHVLLSTSTCLLHHLHDHSHGSTDLPEEHSGNALQTSTDSDLTDVRFQFVFKPETEGSHIIVRDRWSVTVLILSLISQIFGDLFIGGFNALELEVLVNSDLLEEDLIDIISNNEDGYIALFEDLHEGAAHSLLLVLTSNKVNTLLTVFHALDVVINGDVILSLGGLVSHELEQGFLIVIISHQTFF